MKNLIIIVIFTSIASIVKAQVTDTNLFYNSADQLLASNSRLMIGGYGEVHYNQPLSSDLYQNGKLDVHRMVMLFGYNFGHKTQFITELEFEHVKEVYVEQAFLQHKINDLVKIRAGLLLTPMGIINEYHEPTVFLSVERPNLDNALVPTTWREIGAGITGTYLPLSLKYQAYLLNGFAGYSNGDAKLGGKKPLRGGRQKGAESFTSSPNVSGKIEYFGFRGINLGLSGYFGKTQSTLYNGIDKSDKAAIATADSSVVGISMVGIDARYNKAGIQARGQFYLASLSNTEAYNAFTLDTDGNMNDLGDMFHGFYIETGYNVFNTAENIASSLVPFIRYSMYDLHAKTSNTIQQNDAYNLNIITTGIAWTPSKGSVFKADVQFAKSKADKDYSTVLNLGVGVMF